VGAQLLRSEPLQFLRESSWVTRNGKIRSWRSTHLPVMENANHESLLRSSLSHPRFSPATLEFAGNSFAPSKHRLRRWGAVAIADVPITGHLTIPACPATSTWPIGPFKVKRVRNGYNQRHNLPPTVHRPKRLTRLPGSMPSIVFESWQGFVVAETLAVIGAWRGRNFVHAPRECSP
jgi:hypothetical protein